MNFFVKLFSKISFCMLFIFPLQIYAQVGNIKGVLKDGISNEPLIAASILIRGTSYGASTDINGAFQINDIKAGNYNLILSYISYQTDTLSINVYADQTTLVNSFLFENTNQLDNVVITGSKITNTDVSVITELRKADLVATGISAQQISLSQDRDAAQVLKRVPGVTIIGNKFVNVRGLSERYSVVTLNGVIAPSIEVDSRAFAFDLIPSTIIDRMLVYKSGAAQLPGDFAGAIVNIDTKSIVEENSLSLTIGSSYRVGTTGKDFTRQESSKTDWLGYDDGLRQLPASFPSTAAFSSLDENTLTNYSKSLPNNWGISTAKASPDYKMNIDFSKTAYLGKLKLSNVSSVSYSSSRQRIDQKNYYYEAFNTSTEESPRRYFYEDIRDAINTRAGFLSNFSFQINARNRIEFRNLFNQQAVSQVTTRKGVEDIQGFDVSNRALNFSSRNIYFGQLAGRHSATDRVIIKWVGAYSNVNADQPDYRRIRSQRPESSNQPYAISIPPNASTFDAGRFYSYLNEEVFTYSADLEYKLKKADTEVNGEAKISFGYYGSATRRDFNARWFSYSWASLNNQPVDVTLSTIEDIFKEENIGNSGIFGQAPYFILKEGTAQSDTYTGKNNLSAGYVSIAIPFANSFRLSTGSRFEHNNQRLNSFDTNGEVLKVENSISSILPFLNLSFDLTQKSLFRLAGSKTLNRPVFREIAQFNFYDFDKNANVSGNKDLINSDVYNADLSFEYYPSKSEKISIGTFFKHFKNPIETGLIQGSNLNYTFLNAESARNFGAEVEIRKSFAEHTNNIFIKRLSITFNAALINSKVVLPESASNQDSIRALQGQSPYVFNTGIYYNDLMHGWQINVSHNISGKRIYAVGSNDGQNPTQYEMPRHLIDLTIAKSINERLEVKAGIQDMLNQQYRIIQDSNRDKKITEIDEPIQNFKFGQVITLSITYKI
jgi:TonB-dependent receptor